MQTVFLFLFSRFADECTIILFVSLFSIYLCVDSRWYNAARDFLYVL